MTGPEPGEAIPGVDAAEVDRFMAMVRGQPAPTPPAPVRRGPSEERVLARIAALTAAAPLVAGLDTASVLDFATRFEAWIMREVDHA